MKFSPSFKSSGRGCTAKSMPSTQTTYYSIKKQTKRKREEIKREIFHFQAFCSCPWNKETSYGPQEKGRVFRYSF